MLHAGDLPDHQPALSYTRSGTTDVNVTMNFPYPGAVIKEKDGLIVNVTVANSGTLHVNQSFNVTLHIQNKNNQFHKFLDQYQVDGLGAPGNSTTFSFKNWTTFFMAGYYTVNVTTQLGGDTVMSNNTALLDIHVLPDNETVDMVLGSARVLNPSGTTDHLFNYSVIYTYDSFPENINVTIDDEPFDLLQADITDLNASDGKGYYYITKLETIGMHTYQFQASFGNNSTASNILNGPWINLTLQNPQVRPYKGNITDLYNFTVTYGDYNNNPKPGITLSINLKTFDFYPINPFDEDFSDANNNFYCKVYGYELGLGPLKWSITAKGGDDTLTVGPFNFTGPSNNTGFLRGNVKKSDGFDLKDVNVILLPLLYTTKTDGSGNYQFEVPTGHKYQLIFHKDGFYNRTEGSITIPKDKVVYKNVTMFPLPVGGDVLGWVVDADRGSPIQGATVSAETDQGTITTSTNSIGYYEINGIPQQDDVNLTVEKEFYKSSFTLVDVKEAKATLYNFSIEEKNPPFTITPSNNSMSINVSTHFTIDFNTAVNISTFNISLFKHEDGDWVEVNVSLSYDNETYIATLAPEGGLIYITDYKMILSAGLQEDSGKLYLWRDFSLFYRTTFKSLESIVLYPDEYEEEIPVNASIEIILDVEVDPSTVNIILKRKEGSSLNGKKTTEHFNAIDSPLVYSRITYDPDDELKNNTIYFVSLLDTLTDTLGNVMLPEDKVWYFKTWKDDNTPPDGLETDSDGDSLPDEWEENYGLDPDDATDAIENPDNDNLTNLEEYRYGKPGSWVEAIDGVWWGGTDPTKRDTDGDGMPDGWEVQYSLNPLDPTDADQDADGDGYTNKQEYDKGSNPLDDKDPPAEPEKNNTAVWYITTFVIIVFVLIILMILFIIARSRREIREQEAEAEEEELKNGFIEKKRHKAKRSRSREEEEVLEESESFGLDLEEAERAFMDDYVAEEIDESDDYEESISDEEIYEEE
jgi:hypothetical protein